MRIILFTYSFLFCILCFSQRDYTYGSIYDVTNQSPIEGAYVRNITTDLLTSTNSDGEFKIPIKAGDTLVITHIGYAQEEFVFTPDSPADPLEVWLTPETVKLPEVEVTVFPEYWRFKQKILDTQPVDSSVVVFGLDAIPLNAYELEANEQKIKPPDYHPPTIGIGFNMDGLTKKGKEKRKLQTILAQKSMLEKAYAKFNREWVGDATKLQGDELTDFIAFCKFTPKYIVETSLFEIHQQMMVLLDDFKAEKKKSKGGQYSPGA